MKYALRLGLIASLAISPALAEGTNGQPGPSSSVQIGSQDVSGNLQPASPTNPVPVTGTITASSATQANPGSDATKATAVQGVTGGKAVATNTTQIGGVNVSAPTSGSGAIDATTTRTTLATDDPAVQGIGATNASAAANPAATAGINGVLKGFWTSLNTAIATLGSTQVVRTALYDGSGNIVDPTAAVKVYGGDTPCHIATNTTTTCKSGAGAWTSLCINTKGASANVATVYDSLTGSGTVLAVIDTTTPWCGPRGYSVATGITVVTATGTAADLTLGYH